MQSEQVCPRPALECDPAWRHLQRLLNGCGSFEQASVVRGGLHPPPQRQAGRAVGTDDDVIEEPDFDQF
jgi:hypothetical protein